MLLVAEKLTKIFSVDAGFFATKKRSLTALCDVSFNVARGETLGIVGESGCGKTTLAQILCGILRPTAGRLLYGPEITHPDRDIQLVPQNPFESMDPFWNIGDSIKEPLLIHRERAHAQRKLEKALEQVHLKPDILLKKPQECSGGQRQRAAIARAVILEPKILICDEPTSHLDLSIHAQILNLLIELNRTAGTTLIFISHDMEIVKSICDRKLVLHSGIMTTIKSLRSTS
jgi:ABC-type glutathione transport system ATPase component